MTNLGDGTNLLKVATTRAMARRHDLIAKQAHEKEEAEQDTGYAPETVDNTSQAGHEERPPPRTLTRVVPQHSSDGFTNERLSLPRLHKRWYSMQCLQ
ncbi:hypothetical protein DL546_008605 [Coniochaeta pulveracea]|uniref:Uncharacterized protein n=1 Tax=Coniochaeta pulveracea TaxID=177199 RepID=A0A420YLY6_9PEZI|nr:hypothetical protein DL546_008605 [Coniochaeta pulveracea]